MAHLIVCFSGAIQRKIPAMFGAFLLLVAVSLAHNSSTGLDNSSYYAATTQTRFVECPDNYSDFCYHGTCRFLISEWEASCICFKGFLGIRCEHVDLLQVKAADHPFLREVALSVIFLAIVTLSSTCFVIYFCKIRKGERNGVTLLKNIQLNDLPQARPVVVDLQISTVNTIQYKTSV
ncbi:protransforming growth factor alpha-like isoform X2 [Rana temporaria]|uniref:protransforming growth factor alpha-like isoform X2 n=1 Tax=Rana temporaria TaxID=8407 RepID=UPI001AAD1493|nr:protransforming growth factor alpha-like isoform X2 [Rana temporaria]